MKVKLKRLERGIDERKGGKGSGEKGGERGREGTKEGREVRERKPGQVGKRKGRGRTETVEGKRQA